MGDGQGPVGTSSFSLPARSASSGLWEATLERSGLWSRLRTPSPGGVPSMLRKAIRRRRWVSGQPRKPPVLQLHLHRLLNRNRNSPASLVQTSYSKLKAAPSVPGALAARNIYIHPVTRITSSWDDPVTLITQSHR